MRVEDYTGITDVGKTGSTDLVSKLNTGDVIRAKVLEITSDEAVLKVFDGIILRAKMLESINAKAGDTIMLKVSSKHEGTLFLASVKSSSQMAGSSTEALKSMLEKIQAEPNQQNLLLAAEFLKAGAPVTAEQMEKASALINNIPGMDIEKAVFLTLKELISDNPDENELLSRLLDGDVKLGQLLTEIGSIPDSLKDSNMVRNNGQKSVPMKQEVSASFGGAHANLDEALQSALDDINPDINLPEPEAANQEHFKAAASSRSLSSSQTGESTSETAAMSDDQIPVSFEKSIDASLDESLDNTFIEDAGKIPGRSSHLQKSQQQKQEPMIQDSVSKSSDAITKAAKKIRDLFVNLDSDKLTQELDVNRIKSQLNEKLKLLKAAIGSSENYTSAVKKEISATVSQIEDTLKLLHRMNAENVLYYQLPINLAGRGTTAELYVMKRQRGKKKLDPRNAVMFISLDTNRLGRVETLLDVKDGSVTLNIRTESKHISDFIKENIKELYNALSACGYKLVGVRYTVVDAATTLIGQEKLLAEIARGNHARIDYRI